MTASGDMRFHSRRSVKPGDTSPNGTLFGGNLLQWIDEECAIYGISQLGNWRVVTKYMSEIEFVSSAQIGDLIELGLDAYEFGRTSITLRCQARNLVTGKTILSIERIVMVGLDENGRPHAHGHSEPIGSYERIPKHQVLAEGPAFSPVASRIGAPPQ